MVDIPTEVVNESIRKKIDEALNELGDEVGMTPGCPMWELLGIEEQRDLAALNVAMTRIIKSVSMN